jgi:NitT/TauT family transport system substrate-binding protein
MTIRLTENFRAVFYAPFYAATALGAWRAAGVDVAIRESPDPLSTHAALRAGETDVIWGGPLRVMIANEQDPAAQLVAFCNGVERDPFFIVGRLPHPGFTPADLVGKTLATVSEVPTPWLCLADDLRRAGADPHAVHRRAAGTLAGNARALFLGEVEAIQTFQPWVEELLRDQTGVIWYAQADRGLTAYTTLITRRETLAHRRDELRGMVQAMARTLTWMAATPGTDIARLLADRFPHTDQPILAAAIDRYKALGLWARSPVLAREGFDRLQAAMRAGGALRGPVAFEACVDNSLAEEIASK